MSRASGILEKSENPLPELQKWLEEALGPAARHESAFGKDIIKASSAKGSRRRGFFGEPWAAALSTSDSRGRPSSRIVLVKKAEIKKSSKSAALIFFTNYRSAKGRDLDKNPQASLLFYWPLTGRQLRVQGAARKTPRRESLAYWETRSRASQLSQQVSKQSSAAASRKAIEALRRAAAVKFRRKNIPCPAHWGGYRLSIRQIEFWIERESRFHDRFLFKKTRRGWSGRRLFP